MVVFCTKSTAIADDVNPRDAATSVVWFLGKQTVRLTFTRRICVCVSLFGDKLHKAEWHFAITTEKTLFYSSITCIFYLRVQMCASFCKYYLLTYLLILR